MSFWSCFLPQYHTSALFSVISGKSYYREATTVLNLTNLHMWSPSPLLTQQPGCQTPEVSWTPQGIETLRTQKFCTGSS